MAPTIFDVIGLAFGIVALCGVTLLVIGVSRLVAQGWRQEHRLQALRAIPKVRLFGGGGWPSNTPEAKLIRAAAICGAVFSLGQIGALIAAYFSRPSL